MSTNTTEITADNVANLTALTEPTARTKFAKIIENFDVDDIEYLLHGAAYRSDEGEILELLWNRAFDEGCRKGYREGEEKGKTLAGWERRIKKV